MIVIEGADGTGKSTLAARLGEALGWRVQPFGVPQQPAIQEYLHWLVDQPDNEVICDRFHVGEDVYGPIWRGRGLDPHLRWVIELALMTRGAVLVHVTGPPGAVADVLRERGDELVEPTAVAGIIASFMTQCRASWLPRVTIDRWGGRAPDTLLDALMAYADRAKRVWAYREAFPGMPGIGSVLEPGVAYVGERPNPKTLGLTRGVPFAHGPAGDHLIGSLHRLGLLRQVYLTNAVKDDGDDELVGQELRWIQPRQVVALGKLASRVLTKHKIPHAAAIHPMHARRFHWRTMDYDEHLARVMSDA